VCVCVCVYVCVFGLNIYCKQPRKKREKKKSAWRRQTEPNQHDTCAHTQFMRRGISVLSLCINILSWMLVCVCACVCVCVCACVRACVRVRDRETENVCVYA
jgi:hypothetical protein